MKKRLKCNGEYSTNVQNIEIVHTEMLHMI